MESVLSGATKKVLEMARKKDKFIDDKESGGGGKMFSAAKLVAKAIYDGLQMQIGDDGSAGSNNNMLPGKRSQLCDNVHNRYGFVTNNVIMPLLSSRILK